MRHKIKLVYPKQHRNSAAQFIAICGHWNVDLANNVYDNGESVTVEFEAESHDIASVMRRAKFHNADVFISSSNL